MSKKHRIGKINKNDYFRVLVTETLPYETPIIFSNDGLYHQCKNPTALPKIFQCFLEKLILPAQGNENTIPFTYKVRKTATERRQLSLIHPQSQVQFVDFYKRYDQSILHYCQKSPSSIRSPKKVANAYYIKTKFKNINLHKAGRVASLATDRISRHSPSYFAYTGYDRMYKFYESQDFFKLESKYEILQTLDVSKCFDSIYTHTISWALKDKDFTKAHVSVSSTFAQEFDSAIRRANHNETNGIVIGPEVSRIFSEIIFQEIDALTIKDLASRKLSPYTYNHDYSIRRYVDDVLIFANTIETAKDVYNAYSENLSKFNLHPNQAKATTTARPFATLKSNIISDITRTAQTFFDEFLDEIEETIIIPKKIFNKWTLTRGFIKAIKCTCSRNNGTYDDISSYLISSILERIKKIVNISATTTQTISEGDFRVALETLLDVSFYLYNVSPSVSASYKLCTSIILAVRFSENKLPKEKEQIKQTVFELIEQTLANKSLSKYTAIEKFVSLEAINILLAAHELGENYLLAPETVSRIFSTGDELNYFDLVSCLYYIKDYAIYQTMRTKIDRAIDERLRDLSSIKRNTEKACLLLDMLACPYINPQRKTRWILESYKVFQVARPTSAELDEILNSTRKTFWFVKWHEFDLLNILEKKELRQVY